MIKHVVKKVVMDGIEGISVYSSNSNGRVSFCTFYPFGYDSETLCRTLPAHFLSHLASLSGDGFEIRFYDNVKEVI